MDTFHTTDLRSLMAYRAEHCVSIYLPTHPSGPDAAQDAVRLKNLVDEAEQQLVAHKMRAADARELLRPMRDVIRDEPFWLHRAAGLALFAAPGEFSRYRLPIAFAPEVMVNRRYHIKPLIPLFEDLPFWVLDLNQRQPRLYRGSRFDLAQQTVPNMPGPRPEALNYEAVDGGSQVHTAMRGVDGKQGGVFHGQGGIRATAKDELAQYLRTVDHAVVPALGNSHWPLVPAGVEYVVAIFRSLSRYPHLTGESVIGNAEHWQVGELHAKAWTLVEQYLERQRREATARFHELQGSGKASDNIREVTPAAAHGKVDTLLVETDRRLWGTFDANSNQVELRESARPGDEDLIDLATVETLNNRGKVIATSREYMPTVSPVAAVYRY